MRRWASVVALGLLWGCGGTGTGDAEVNLDLTALWQQAGVTTDIDAIWVRVYDDTDYLEWEALLESVDEEAVVNISAGLARHFVVEARFYDWSLGAEIPTYWGDAYEDITAGAITDLVVPVFPAGRLTGTVNPSDYTYVPYGVVLVADNPDPRADVVDPVRIPLTDGSFTVTLPDGSYDLEVSYELEGTTYASGEVNNSVTIRQGEVSSFSVEVEPQ